jgi:hypothetical protein
MTATLRHDGALQPSEAELQRAVKRALDQAGCKSFDELAEQARSGRFTSSRARMAWVAIGGLREYA